VRYGKPHVDLKIVDEVIEKTRTGLPGMALPPSIAKRQLALIWASKAVLAAELAVMGKVEAVTLRAVGTEVGGILYTPEADWDLQRAEYGDFEYCVNILVSCYAGRAIEEVEYGQGGTTLKTATEVATAGELAQWLCVNSELNPALFGLKVHYDAEDMSSAYMPMKPVRLLRYLPTDPSSIL
jgi:ATP-dependent Zn protease